MDYEEIKKRFGKYGDKKLTRQKAVKLYCKELCACGDYQSWANCSCIYCPLWKFRKGTEIRVNLGSFGVRDKITTHKQKSILKQGEKSGFKAKNTIIEPAFELQNPTIPTILNVLEFRESQNNKIQEETGQSFSDCPLLNNQLNLQEFSK